MKGRNGNEGHRGIREDESENKQTGHSGGRSNNQRLYNLEHDQEENLANAERLRKDLHDLSCTVAMRSEMYELNASTPKWRRPWTS